MMKRIAAFLLALFLLAVVEAPAEESAVRVSYLGPEGTYTQEAAQFFFQSFSQGGETLIPCETVEAAIADVQAGRSLYAVIPQENTLGGAVVNDLDALLAADGVWVVGEVVLPISQTLMGVAGASLADVRTVCSHAQGLAQSAAWRAEHLPHAEAVEMASTAAAASYVARQQDKTVAAIAAPGAAALYQLEVLAENVQITEANRTRFYVLSAAPLRDGELPRAVFAATCEGSRIDDIILALRESGLEMVALHDRPEGSALGSYRFVIEAEDPSGVTQAQIDAMSAVEGVRFLGRFPVLEK